MKIYDMPGFPSPLRVRVALAEKGLASRVEFVRVDVPAAEHKQRAFLEKNPTGTVPVLELDDGTCLAECTAITEYLDNLDGKPTLTGTTPKEKGVIHMMQKRADDQLIDAIGIYFHHATEGLGPQLKPYKSPEWQERAVWGERNREKALNGMRYFDQVLQTRPYVAGDQFSMADITVWAGLVFAGFAQIAIPEECTALAAWNARVSERPSVKNPA
ncbi:glutathione S-transferase [Pseudomonas gingeri NCPPB 3146 = LMG 5327]|uniref:Glutathione S-transferase n=2 Tax=Pseudomonas gingeri TaxID=117681 RepID=A0A7Y7XW83_9PSED|nr:MULTISPECIES: glutathione S-transferase [Pseudomonas]NWC13419.1 glutathione S-transferase [Pseudomonas gingeri]NWE45164.1 glutathione S-transferase [Pseudomonas gingeri]NWE72926.1 glutathione S-transferase [Pseudomonas gingeri]PNQ94461.1 glutathione S-transferase [Pseudomonas gingeri NCPPB 3146 = LMG 5327]BBP77214.1 glutathione S-transferase [Pseudomonas sp. Ost2]